MVRGAPGRSRTHSLVVRSNTLYLVELRAQVLPSINCKMPGYYNETTAKLQAILMPNQGALSHIKALRFGQKLLTNLDRVGKRVRNCHCWRRVKQAVLITLNCMGITRKIYPDTVRAHAAQRTFVNIII